MQPYHITIFNSIQNDLFRYVKLYNKIQVRVVFLQSEVQFFSLAKRSWEPIQKPTAIWIQPFSGF